MEDNAIKGLLGIIESQLGWGDPGTWASRDFEELNILIQEKTKISLSSSTLRRVWGKADYKNQPSLTTLDTLAKFAGFEGWKNYRRNAKKVPKVKWIKPLKLRMRWVFGGIVITLTISALAFWKIAHPANVHYTFGSHLITHDLPNTVIFTYDARFAPNDSVFIQQSWDASKRVRVDKNNHVFNSIYYKPGFYHAKLTIGNQVSKEHPLLIPTNGWLALIDQASLPVYLNRQEFIINNSIHVTPSTIANHHIAMEPQAPSVEVYNTGNFQPVPIGNFSFSTEVKNDYNEGTSRCRQINIILYTNDIPLSIPLAAPGCVAALKLLDGHKELKGATTDLSGFGVNLSDWIEVTLAGHRGKIDITVNKKLVFTINSDNRQAQILGVGFIFQGSAGIRKVNLISADRLILKDFN